MERLLNEKLTVAGYGKFLEVNNLCAECGSILPPKEHEQERYWRMPLKKSKKEYKVGGRRSRFPPKFWSKPKGMRIQIAMPK